MPTGSGTDASGCGGLAIGDAASGVMGVGGISASWDACAGDTTNGGVGGDAASFSFVPKTNSSIALPSGLRFWYSFQRSHDFLKQPTVLFARI
jgi:hypothetical protein